ncbi:MAG: hypothetical protein GY906_35630 [bacterium]|nr:hypothetical protein [bacterium]
MNDHLAAQYEEACDRLDEIPGELAEWREERGRLLALGSSLPRHGKNATYLGFIDDTIERIDDLLIEQEELEQDAQSMAITLGIE